MSFISTFFSSRKNTAKSELIADPQIKLDEYTLAVIDPMMQWDLAMKGPAFLSSISDHWKKLTLEPDSLIRGRLTKKLSMLDSSAKLIYLAPSPPLVNSSFQGSGYPFTSAEEAFKYSPNFGMVNIGYDGSYEIPLKFPSAYYSIISSREKIPPVVHVRLAWPNGKVGPIETVKLGNGIQYRHIRGGPSGYNIPELHFDVLKHNIYKHRRSELPLGRSPQEYYYQRAYPSPLLPATLITNAESETDYYKGLIIPY